MKRLTVMLATSAIFLLPACQQHQPAEAPAQPGVSMKQPTQVSPKVAESYKVQPYEPAAQPPAGQSSATAEFMGQAPKVEDAPETVVLEAKNGNITLPHRMHAGMMECKTCHGDAKPGKMADFNKDKAHPLCQGCHKEKGAGPTKCADCHKKS